MAPQMTSPKISPSGHSSRFQPSLVLAGVRRRPAVTAIALFVLGALLWALQASHGPAAVVADNDDHELSVGLRSVARVVTELPGARAAKRVDHLSTLGYPQRPGEAALWDRLASVKVLFAVSRQYYEATMDGYFFEEFDACQRHPRLDCTLWGSGFPKWKDGLTLSANIESRFGRADHFQILFFQAGYPPFELGPPHPEVVRSTRLNEDWGSPGYNSPLADYLNASIIMNSFAQDLAENAATLRAPHRVHVHVPMSSDPTVYDVGVSPTEDRRERPIDALMVGAAGPTCYPMRARLVKLIKTGKLPGTIRGHPTYVMKSAEARAQQRLDYIKQLQSSKIVFVTASHYRYRLQKFAEVAFSGALMMGTLPQEHEELFRDIMVELREDDSDEYIQGVVAWWLEHEKERKQMAARALVAARRFFSWDVTFADRLYLAYGRLLRGEYGWWFPEPFTVREPRRNTCDCNARSSDAEYVLRPRCPHVPLPPPASA